MSLHWMKFCPGPSGCLRHFGTDLNFWFLEWNVWKKILFVVLFRESNLLGPSFSNNKKNGKRKKENKRGRIEEYKTASTAVSMPVCQKAAALLRRDSDEQKGSMFWKKIMFWLTETDRDDDGWFWKTLIPKQIYRNHHLRRAGVSHIPINVNINAYWHRHLSHNQEDTIMLPSNWS